MTTSKLKPTALSNFKVSYGKHTLSLILFVQFKMTLSARVQHTVTGPVTSEQAVYHGQEMKKMRAPINSKYDHH